MAKSKGSKNQQNVMNFAMIAVAGTAVGIAAIAVVLNTLSFSQAGDNLRELLARNYLNQYAGVIDSQFQQVQSRVEYAATTTGLDQLLQAGNESALEAGERSLRRGFPEAERLMLIPKGSADSAKATQGVLGFADLDMVRQAENGIAVPAEIRKRDETPLLHLVRPVQSGEAGPIRGVLLVSLDTGVISNALQAFDAGAGVMQLVQRFKDGGRSVAALEYGHEADRSATIIDKALSNPNWTVQFQPSRRLTEHQLVARPAFWGVIGVGALVALLSIGAAFFLLRRTLVADAKALLALLSSGGKPENAGNRIALAPLREIAGAVSQGSRKARTKPGLGQPDAAAAAAAAAAAQAAPREAEAAPQGDADTDDGASPIFQDVSILDELEDEDSDEEDPEEAGDTHIRGPTLPAGIFRAYDIRGIVGEELNEESAYYIGMAIGSEAKERGEQTVAVCKDARLSGPMLSQSLIRGLADSGRSVIDIGTATTPVLYFATQTTGATSGVMVTGSHNPPNYNGFKIVLAGNALADREITALYDRITSGGLVKGEGEITDTSVTEDYMARICEDIALARALKVVVDCGNGVAGAIAPALFERLGCDVIPLYCEPDGNFPNHHPDPSKPENLKDLIARVQAEGADIGLAFDGDGDRIGVVTNAGNVIWPDRLLMLFAKDIVTRNPGADVIFDVKCTRHLGRLISNYGGRPTMWKTGHSLIKAKMRETGALLGGEMSGHVFFKERWFGFDDGIYAAARLLELLSMEERDAESIFGAFPVSLSTPEINVHVPDDEKFALIKRLCAEGQFGDGKISNIDGVRVDYPGGWGLIRASNTTPNLVLRFEANTEEELERLKTLFRDQLLAMDGSIEATF